MSLGDSKAGLGFQSLPNPVKVQRVKIAFSMASLSLFLFAGISMSIFSRFDTHTSQSRGSSTFAFLAPSVLLNVANKRRTTDIRRSILRFKDKSTALLIAESCEVAVAPFLELHHHLLARAIRCTYGYRHARHASSRFERKCTVYRTVRAHCEMFYLQPLRSSVYALLAFTVPVQKLWFISVDSNLKSQEDQ